MNHATNKDGNNPDGAIGADKLAPAEEFEGFFTIIRPPQEGGDSKGDQADGKEDGTDGTDGAEGIEHAELRSIGMARRQEGGGEGNAGKGADKDRPKRGGIGNQGLLNGVIGFNGSRYDGGRA